MRTKIAAALVFGGHLVFWLSLLQIVLWCFDSTAGNLKIWLVATVFGFVCMQVGGKLVKNVI